MADVSIRFRAEGAEARRETAQLKKEVRELRQELGQTAPPANQAAASVDRLGDEAREAAVGVTSLGRSIFRTSAEAQRFGGVFRDSGGRLREANGQYARTGESIASLGQSFRRGGVDMDRFTQGAGGASRGAGLLRGAFAALGPAIGAVGIETAARAVIRLGTVSVQAATKMEGYTNAFAALGLGAAGARRRIRELQELADLPGVSFEQAVQGAVRLRVIGIEGDRATGLIRELGNALAITGDTDLSGAIRAITQIVQLQRVNQEEINQLVERSGAAAQALQEAFGTTRAEAIQASLEASGQSVQDFVDILVNSLSKQARVSTDTAANAFQNLGNATFRLTAAIGEHLLPAVKLAARGMTAYFNVLTDVIEGPVNLSRALADVTESVKTFDKALSAADSIEKREKAIAQHIETLKSLRSELASALPLPEPQGDRNIGDVFTGGAIRAITPRVFRPVLNAAGIIRGRELIEAEKQFEGLNEELEQYQALLEGNTYAIDFFKDRVDALSKEIQTHQGNIVLWTQRQRELSAAGQTSSKAYKDLSKQIVESTNAIRPLTKEQERYQTLVETGIAILDESEGAFSAFIEAQAERNAATAEAARNYEKELLILADTAEKTREVISRVIDPDAVEAAAEAALTASNAYFNHQATIAENNIADEKKRATELERIRLARRDAETAIAADKNKRLKALGEAEVDAHEARQREIIAANEALHDAAIAAKKAERDAVLEADADLLLGIENRIEQQGIALSAFYGKDLAAYIRHQGYHTDALVDRLNAEQNIITRDLRLGFLTTNEAFAARLASFNRFTKAQASVTAGRLRQEKVLRDAAEKESAASAKAEEASRKEANARILASSESTYKEASRLLRDSNIRTRHENVNYYNDAQRAAVAHYRTLLELGVEDTEAKRELRRILLENAKAYYTREQQFQSENHQRTLKNLRAIGEQIEANIKAINEFERTAPRTGEGSSKLGLFARSLRDSVFSLDFGEEVASTGIRLAGRLKDIERDRLESIEDLEREYSERILAINEEKGRRLAEVAKEIEEEEVRRLASIREAFETAKQDEIEARQDAADRISEIEDRAAEERERLRLRLTERIFEMEARLEEDLAELNEGFLERETERAKQRLEITERAAERRVAVEQDYIETIQDINNRLVEDIRSLQEGLQENIDALQSGYVQRQTAREAEIVRATEAAAAARADANRQYSETMEGIYRDLVEAWDALEDGFTERTAERAADRIEIEQRAVAARLAANEAYSDRVARISTELVDTIRRIEDEIVSVQERHAAERFAIEAEVLADRAEANADYARRLTEIEAEREGRIAEQERRLAAVRQTAFDARVAAERDFSETFQRIQNDLVDRVVGIQQDLNDTVNDLRDQQLETERERLESLVALHEEMHQRLEDLERERGRTIEDLRRQFQEDQFDLAVRLDRDIQDIQSDPSLSEEERAERIERLRKEHQRRVADLTREFHRDVLELERRQQRQQEDLARRAAAQKLELERRAAEELARLEEQENTARGQAQTDIADAETEAGVSFQEAQANYVPALSAHQEALLVHTEALQAIAKDLETERAALDEERSEALKEEIDATAEAAKTFRETLAGITEAEKERLSALATETAETIKDLREQRTTAESETGLSFEEALGNYAPAVDLNTQALNALTLALGGADTERQSALEGLESAGREDVDTVRAAQQALEAAAGVSIEEARANYVPALTAATEASMTLNTSIQALEESFKETIAGIREAGLVDRQALSESIRVAIAEAAAQQAALEVQAGTSFAEAAAAFQPGVSDITQAGLDRETALTDIDQDETEALDAVSAAAIKDRLETDAAITETRDAFLKASAQETLKYQTDIRQINNTMRMDVQEVKDVLKERLADIDKNLSDELAEIREQKQLFDTRMNELITAINEQANIDLSELKADTTAMRAELEKIAKEAENNAWKSALLKMANTGITIAGVAVGAAVGNPVAGGQVGAVVGGLVEQAGNELFHFEQTDLIARRLARHAGSRYASTPNYLPSPDQLRNARDVGREVVSGFTEGLVQQGQSSGGGAFGGFSEEQEITATIQIQFPDGAVQEIRDQVVRLQAQNRIL